MAVGGDLGVITASNYATVKRFPAAELRRVAGDNGVRLQAAGADMAQWPLMRFSSATLAAHLVQLQVCEEGAAAAALSVGGACGPCACSSAVLPCPAFH